MKKQIISIIAAMANNRVIGKDNDMPWGRFPADLHHFKKITSWHPVIMGRKTYESIGKPLPDRMNVVISSNVDLRIEGCSVVSSIDEALELTEHFEEIFIIGGGKLYKDTLEIADKLYLTLIDLEIDGDTYFPEYENKNFYKIKSDKFLSNEHNKYNCEFTEFIREKNNENT